MIMNSRDQDQHSSKQEGESNDNKLIKTSPTPSRQWAAFRNPRIVRVSRSFGGKDRHSKVCTVRGLRDRRIRLSVPTAIQLYDLQDRLGLSQPSKVVDWLLDATKTEIDKLPPLQMPPGNFSQFFQPLASSSSNSHQSPPNIPHHHSSLPHFLNPNSSSTMMDNRSKYWIASSDQRESHDKDKWIASNEQENQQGNIDQSYASHLTPQNFFPNILTNALPFNPYYQIEASNLSLSQFGNNPISNQGSDRESQMGGSQLYFCPSTATIPAIIPPLHPYLSTTMENNINPTDPRQINHFQFLSSSSTSQHLLPNHPLIPTLHLISSPLKSLTLNVNPKILHPQETDHHDNEGGGAGS